MPSKKYRDRGFSVFNRNGEDLPQNPVFDEFEDVLKLEERKTKTAIERLQEVKEKFKRIVLFSLGGLGFVVYTVVVISLVYLVIKGGNNPETVEPEITEKFIVQPTETVENSVTYIVVTDTLTPEPIVFPTMAVFPTATEVIPTVILFPTITHSEPTKFPTAIVFPTPTKQECFVTVQANAGNVNIRSGPGTQYDIVKVVQNNQSLWFYGTNAEGDWYLVGGNEWIWAELVSDPICR